MAKIETLNKTFSRLVGIIPPAGKSILAYLKLHLNLLPKKRNGTLSLYEKKVNLILNSEFTQ